MADAVVIGGGVIGLAVARELSGEGLRVTLVERGELGRAASHAAAGMLAPQAEADTCDAFFDLARASRLLYPAFTAKLAEETGIDVELDETGLLYLAFTDEEATTLERRCAWQRAASLAVESLTPEEARRREPHLSADLRGALFFPEDAQIENRRLVHALATSCAQRGVELLTNTEVVAVETTRSTVPRVESIVTARGRITTSCVVVASGAWASRLAVQSHDAVAAAEQARAACGEAARLCVEPVRGQILCFEASPPLVRHVIYGSRVYFVPRRDGRLLVGATVEHVGFDCRATAAGLHALLNPALEVLPRIGELTLLDQWAGLRPRAADGLPVIGRSEEVAGLHFATGHYRNGILLAPLTAQLVRRLVTSSDAESERLHPFAPNRFAPSVRSVAGNRS